MEKIDNRKRFIQQFPQICKLVKLTPEFNNGLYNHRYFKEYMTYIKDFEESVKIVFILLELTRERSTCEAVINLLKECGQTEASSKLSEFNRSSGPMPLVLDIYLEVARSIAPKKDLSNCYNLLKKKRGRVILYNTMEEPQKPDLYINGQTIKINGLLNETKRFKDLFERLHFSVEVINKMTAQELKDKLQYLSLDKSLEQEEAFIFMAITHGENEKILGFNACDVIRKFNFGEISEAARGEAMQVINTDLIDIKDIIEIFSDESCQPLRSKPKLFFFTCCRTLESQKETPETTDSEPMDINDDPVKITPKKLGNRPSVDMFVAYACSKGYKTFFNPIHGFTYFGQALSHSIAQYACEESLSQIMSRTSKRLKRMYDDLEEEGKKELLGNYAIEVTTYAMNNQLYFNPGIVE